VGFFMPIFDPNSIFNLTALLEDLPPIFSVVVEPTEERKSRIKTVGADPG
jgi:hypothetical protein